MMHGSFTHPTIGRIGFEFEMASNDSDAYLVAFAPDHEDWPERIEADDAPPDWIPLAWDAVPLAIAERDDYRRGGE